MMYIEVISYLLKWWRFHSGVFKRIDLKITLLMPPSHQRQTLGGPPRVTLAFCMCSCKIQILQFLTHILRQTSHFLFACDRPDLEPDLPLSFSMWQRQIRPQHHVKYYNDQIKNKTFLSFPYIMNFSSKKCQKHHIWAKNYNVMKWWRFLFLIQSLQTFTWCWGLVYLSSMQKETYSWEIEEFLSHNQAWKMLYCILD